MAMTEAKSVLNSDNNIYENSANPYKVSSLVDFYKQVWWDTGTQFPLFPLFYSQDTQKANDKKIDEETTKLINAAKHIISDVEEIKMFRENARTNLLKLTKELFFIYPDEVNFIEKSGMRESARSFFQMAREFDPDIPFSDIYQAGRNIITANLIQLLLGLPVRTTPSLFAYSMLYPYTDNYLDSSEVSLPDKKNFNQRFRNRLLGETIQPLNKNEEIINSLIQIIESEWDRQSFPQVYQSLLTIHTAQVKSLDLVSSGISPFEKDILGITFEKGGTSVLTDGYLAAGTLSSEQAIALFGFGTFTQLMDDMEDICTDIQENRASLFSISVPHWKLDTICNRFINFGRKTIGNLGIFPGEYVSDVTTLINKCIDPMVLGSIPASTGFFSKSYIANIEQHMPVKFSSLKKQQAKITRNKSRIIQLVEASLVSDTFSQLI